MTVPTAEHELRRALLGAVADLAGYLVDIASADDLIPEVVRLHSHRPALVVGDAKATETAGSSATQARIARYIEHSRRWNAAGFDLVIAICHPLDTGPWDMLIQRAASRAGRVVGSSRSTPIDECSVVTWAPIHRQDP